MEALPISGQEYESQYVPFGGFLLVKKDMAPERHGAIFTPRNVREDHTKFTTTGVIVAKSMFCVFETTHENYIYDHLSVGDRIGFGMNTPLFSPSPPSYQFEGDDKLTYITIHMTDVLCLIADTKEKKSEIEKRFKGGFGG